MEFFANQLAKTGIDMPGNVRLVVDVDDAFLDILPPPAFKKIRKVEFNSPPGIKFTLSRKRYESVFERT